MSKNIDVKRHKKKIKPYRQPVTSGEEVWWTINALTGTEVLAAKSTDTNFTFNINDVGSKKIGGALNYVPPVSVNPTYDVFYSISVDGIEVSSAYLVIDTIGPPIDPCLPEGEDESVGDDYECDEQN